MPPGLQSTTRRKPGAPARGDRGGDGKGRLALATVADTMRSNMVAGGDARELEAGVAAGTGVAWPRPVEAWRNVVIAAFLMLATLPGRTQGLGLVTEPLIRELGLDRVAYATWSLWATLLGSVACLPAGWVLDRFGVRRAAVAWLALLACVVTAMAAIQSAGMGLFLALVLSRAIGQGALSVASIASVGKSFPGSHGWPMGVFSILMSILFAVAFVVVGDTVHGQGWRVAWKGVAWGLAGIAVVAWLGFRDSQGAGEATDAGAGAGAGGMTLGEALGTTSFWVFAGSTALFAVATSGVGLFNEALLVERGFAARDLPTFLGVSTVASLVGQGLCGWSMRRSRPGLLMGAAWLGYGASLAGLALVREPWQLWTVATLMGVSAGGVTVLFFSLWGHLFGRLHLGRIQGAAQWLTVLGSAAGPLVFAATARRWGSHAPVLWMVAGLALGIAGVAATAAGTRHSPIRGS